MIKKRIPAAALISLSFKTGTLKPSTFSPNLSLIILFMVVFNSKVNRQTEIKIKRLHTAANRQQTAGFCLL
jgi:hypothetical protein